MKNRFAMTNSRSLLLNLFQWLKEINENFSPIHVNVYLEGTCSQSVVTKYIFRWKLLTPREPPASLCESVFVHDKNNRVFRCRKRYGGSKLSVYSTERFASEKFRLFSLKNLTYEAIWYSCSVVESRCTSFADIIFVSDFYFNQAYSRFRYYISPITDKPGNNGIGRWFRTDQRYPALFK